MGTPYAQLSGSYQQQLSADSVTTVGEGQMGAVQQSLDHKSDNEIEERKCEVVAKKDSDFGTVR